MSQPLGHSCVLHSMPMTPYIIVTQDCIPSVQLRVRVSASNAGDPGFHPQHHQENKRQFLVALLISELKFYIILISMRFLMELQKAGLFSY